MDRLAKACSRYNVTPDPNQEKIENVELFVEQSILIDDLE